MSSVVDHKPALKPCVIEVVEIPHVGFELYIETSAGRKPRYFSLFAENANAEAVVQHEMALIMHSFGLRRGVDRPPPVLKLWEGGDAKP